MNQLSKSTALKIAWALAYRQHSFAVTARSKILRSLTPLTESEIHEHLPDPAVSLGLLTGRPSGNLEVIEFKDRTLYDTWLSGLDPKINTFFYVVATHTETVQAYFRCQEPEPGRVIAACPNDSRKLETIVRTYGDGDCVIFEQFDKTEHLQGALSRLPELTMEERRQLLSAARALEQRRPTDSQPKLSIVSERWSPNLVPVSGEHRRDQFTGDMCNHAGNASRMVMQFGDTIKNTQLGPLVFDACARQWVLDSNQHRLLNRYSKMVAAITEEIALVSDPGDRAALEKWQRKSGNHATVQGTLNQFLARPEIQCDIDLFDIDPWALNTASGYLNLEDGTIVPNQPSYLASLLTPVTYDSSATCPIWNRFVDDCTGGDATAARTLQIVAGYALSGHTDEQVAFYLVGPTRSGKSVFLNTLALVAGGYADNADCQTFLQKKFEREIRPDVLRLAQKRLVVVSELPDRCLLHRSFIKNWSSGSPVTVRNLRRPTVTFTPRGKLFFHGRQLPWGRTRNATFDTLFVLPFIHPRLSGEIDRHLTIKLSKELPGILNWCLQGYRMWLESGLPVIDHREYFRTAQKPARKRRK